MRLAGFTCCELLSSVPKCVNIPSFVDLRDEMSLLGNSQISIDKGGQAVVVVGFYDTFKHLRSSASLVTQSEKRPTNFAQRH